MGEEGGEGQGQVSYFSTATVFSRKKKVKEREIKYFSIRSASVTQKKLISEGKCGKPEREENYLQWSLFFAEVISPPPLALTNGKGNIIYQGRWLQKGDPENPRKFHRFFIRLTSSPGSKKWNPPQKLQATFLKRPILVSIAIFCTLCHPFDGQKFAIGCLMFHRVLL